MAINPDYKDLFKIFLEEKVEYLIVGAHAVIFYAEPRYTKDLDCWVRPSRANARRVWNALKRFGAPLQGIKLNNFTDQGMIYQIGIQPNRIDILMRIKGVSFNSAWQHKVESSYGGIPIYMIGRKDLIRAKKAVRRRQDLIDLERLLQPDDK